MKRLLLVLLLVITPVIAGAAVAAPIAGTFADPTLEARARHLQQQLRCLVCQGQSIDESNAELAADLRQLVRQQIAQGRSDDQIKAYLRARYGDFILMQPPLEPATWLLWLGPFVVLAGAGGVAWRVISRAQKVPESLDSRNISNL
jgi:cytochrome c-type biogenesis protein CcmH